MKTGLVDYRTNNMTGERYIVGCYIDGIYRRCIGCVAKRIFMSCVNKENENERDETKAQKGMQGLRSGFRV